MSDFINTADVIGDEEACAQFVERTVTEYADNRIQNIRSYAFCSCASLTKADFPAVTNVGLYAFASCGSLESANLPLATTVNSYAFNSCKKLASIDLPLLTIVPQGLCAYCDGLETVSVPNAITIGGYAFQECSSLQEINLPEATIIGSSALRGCANLKSIYAPKVTELKDYAIAETGLTEITEEMFPVLEKISGTYCFNSSDNLVSAKFAKLTSVGGCAFHRCMWLEKIDFAKAVSFAAGAMETCSDLKAVILRDTETLSTSTVAMSNLFKNSGIASGKGYIYVPAALLEDYKVATNWIDYADKFRALEDYTVDGTTTGALDETKI